MTVKVTGGAEIIAALNGMKADAVSDLQDVCFTSAETVRSKVVVAINTQKPNPGATPVGKRKHIPAPAGGPPNADTGNLSSRYTTTSIAANGQVGNRVIAGVHYALAQEYGHVFSDGRVLEARPHLIPEFNAEKPRFLKKLKAAMSNITLKAKKKGRHK